MIPASFSKPSQAIDLLLHFGILHEGSFWNGLFLPIETLNKQLQSWYHSFSFAIIMQ